MPQAKGVIAPEKAKVEFLKHVALQPYYVWPSYYDALVPDPRLVYVPE
ncbi:hypothetical protein GTO91_15225 [Heliobacterium undosum]|uniref:Uncharacterized protein n=1 Tax=Heliomicrobium undosum TaxID=121734 RepID=A0A845L5T6_9FIRM|nr:hypothetical protein [Heliomicrobium undosum]MZP31066.1 hypothetical protein [Heliomicrobium undosum]